MTPIESRLQTGHLAVAILLMALMLAATGTPMTAQGGAHVGCPAWTADGTGLVYCGGSGEFTELFEFTPDGEIRQLTFLGGTVTSPDVSADGALVVFAAATPIDPEPQLYVISRTGPRARKVIVGSAIIELEGEQAMRLTSEGANYDPSFEPGADRIVFTTDRSGYPAIWSMNLDGSDQRQLMIALAQ